MALIALRLCRLDFTEALRRELSRLEQCLGVGVGVAAPLLVDARASATRGQPARWWTSDVSGQAFWCKFWINFTSS